MSMSDEGDFQEMTTRSETSSENKMYISLLPKLPSENELTLSDASDGINPLFHIKNEPDEALYLYPDVHGEGFAKTCIKGEDFCDNKSTTNKSLQEVSIGQSVSNEDNKNKTQTIDESFRTIMDSVMMEKDDMLESRDGITLWNESCNYQYKIEDTNKMNCLLENISSVEYATEKEEKIDLEDNKLGHELLSSMDESPQHIQNLHIPENEIFKCMECSYETGVKTYLADHFKRRHSKKTELYKCDECPYESKLKANLVQHYKRVHMGQSKVYKCPQCAYETVVKRDLSIHIIQTHKTDAGMYKCSECPYETNIKRYMGEHNRIHKEDQVYKCTKCSYETKIKKYFYNHNRRHDDRKLYQCSKCSYETRNKRYFTIHYNNRHNETNEVFKCPECPFQSKVKRNLNEHLVLHRKTNETLKCSECSYETKIKKYMTTHKRQQHGDKTTVYKCTECPYETRIKSYFRNHTNNLHREGSGLYYTCPECPYITTKKYCLPVHMRKHKSPKV